MSSTAKMTAAMLSLLSEEPGERRVLERLGYLLGRYIYMADALDDWEKDKKHGDFNPFLQCEDEPEALKRHARASLLLTIGEMGAALDLLELRHFGPILENIIRLGLPQTVEELWQAIQNYGGLTIPAGLTQEQVDAIRAQANDLLAAIADNDDQAVGRQRFAFLVFKPETGAPAGR